jgi:hypothetical protein
MLIHSRYPGAAASSTARCYLVSGHTPFSKILRGAACFKDARSGSEMEGETLLTRKNLVGLARFELATTGLGNRCSIHLSYSPARRHYITFCATGFKTLTRELTGN